MGIVDEIIPLKDIDNDKEFYKGTRFRQYEIGLNFTKKEDNFYEYMLAEVPGNNDYMLLTCVVGHKSGSALAWVKTISDKSRFVVNAKALKYSMGTENTYLSKPNNI
ncbi:hypothetical protein [Winogradskyella sp. SYSU M77433]|uniref:hypothetical protein n=1 Tax=Winogradskyella sp. SYSU M77433 TaxID=3042722 RepID=UPI002480D051|nr:hypothetical protein [Winogradskyella sp. SYSU M77433]MDH7913041.1 hypothetical protein [Winogradskyella sp. SYSU M77433]|tara:strand:+ start:143 stop:463 length:321 start_codon:yes stop_codon:yes gene_type:complete